MKLKSMIGPISAIFPNCILQVDFQTKNRIADFNTKARHIHFEPLQNIEDLRMHYAIDDITGSAFFE
jgi:hypothetical protein